MAAATGGRRRRRSGQHWSTASSPGPLPLPLARGAEVEVRVDGEGFHGSWYEATVVDFAPAIGRRVREYTATYSHLVADDGCSALTENFPASQVRPRPPPPSESSSPPRFHLYDIVEAFHYDGWWTGIVMSTPDPEPGSSSTATVTIGFPITREAIEFPPHLVRPRRDYVDGDWVLSRAAMAAPSYKLRVYKVGEKVEIGRHRDFYGYSWFAATVARVVDDLSYVVDYGEGKAAEYVHWQFIRPPIEHFCRDSESELQLEPGNEVEAYCRGAWSLGEVDRVISGKWKYKVIVGNKKEYRLVTKVVELLKPTNNWNDWIGSQRRTVTAKTPSAYLRRVSMSEESPRSPVDVAHHGDEQHSPESLATKKSRTDLKQLDGILTEGSEHSPHCSLVMGTPLSDQNRNGHVCMDPSAAQLAKSNCVMETAIPSPDYQVQHAGGKLDQQAGGEMDQQVGGKVDESLVLMRLQNAGSSQSTMDSSPLRSCSASESMLPSPLALSSLRPADEHLLKLPNSWSGNQRIGVAKRVANLRTPSMSPVDVTSSGDEHSHDPGSSANKTSRKDLKQLDVILAEDSEHSPHCSLVMDTPLSDQNRNDHLCTDHSATQVAKSNSVMETVIPSLDYRVQQAGGKVDQQAGRKVDESSGFLCRLQNARSSKSTIDSSPFRSCSASESLLPSPHPQSLSSLRPADEYLFKPPNNCSGLRRRIVVAKRLVNLRTLSMSCENSSSRVDVTSNGDEYSLDPGSSATKKSRKDLKQLDGTLAEDLEHSSMVMGTPLSDQNRNDHVSTDHSTTQVAKSNRVMETVSPSIDYRIQQAVGKVGQQAGGKVDESLGFQHRLQNARSSQSTIDSSPLRGCSTSESLLPSPLADGKPLFVKSSTMWPQIEAMDVFSVYPQRPHFLPLREFSPTMHEGMALGLMAVFSNLVRIIRKANIHNSMEWFEDKFSTLRLLEGHGFNVQSFHSTLTKLVKIKSQHAIYLGEMDKLDVEIEVETASLTRIGALLDELQQKLGCLHQEIQKIAAEMETKGKKLSRFRSEQSKLKEAYGDVKQEFHSVLAALPGNS